jgi:hypothetical protein
VTANGDLCGEQGTLKGNGLNFPQIEPASLVVQGILKDKVKILASKQCDVTLKISVA